VALRSLHVGAALPNAPYLITDLIHLYQRPEIPLWYDIGLLMSFVWAGCFLAVASLNMMHQIIRDYVGRAGSWIIVMGMLGLCGLGIYMGRFLRWNSWDIFLYPTDVLGDIGHRLIHPFSHMQAYGVTSFLAAFCSYATGHSSHRNSGKAGLSEHRQSGLSKYRLGARRAVLLCASAQKEQ
jgi:uncharacterized membrane protein